MRKLLIILAALIVGCSNPNYAGGVTEAGNGIIQVSFVDPSGHAIDSVPYSICRPTYRAESDSIESPMHTEQMLAVDSGTWILYAESGGLVALESVTVPAGDTTEITVVIDSVGTISVDSSSAWVVIPGAPKRFAISSGETAVPAGSYQLDIVDQSGTTLTVPVVIVSGETTKIANGISRTSIYDPAILSTVYNVCFDGSTVGYATGNGIVIDRKGIRTHLTSANSPLKSNWARDIRIFGDTTIVATDSGITVFTENDSVTFRGGVDIPNDWVIQFADSPEGLWFVTSGGAGIIRGGKVVQTFSKSSTFYGKNCSAVAMMADSSVVVGGNGGLFRYKSGVWESDTTLSIGSAVTTINGAWGANVVGSMQHGLYEKNGTVWNVYRASGGLIPTDTIYAGADCSDGSILFGGIGGSLIRKSTEEFSSEKIATVSILSIDIREDGSIWIGTMGNGVVVLGQ